VRYLFHYAKKKGFINNLGVACARSGHDRIDGKKKLNDLLAETLVSSEFKEKQKRLVPGEILGHFWQVIDELCLVKTSQI
jgi:hypothetical protein